jgi:hypothetical protein
MLLVDPTPNFECLLGSGFGRVPVCVFFLQLVRGRVSRAQQRCLLPSSSLFFFFLLSLFLPTFWIVTFG